MAGAGAFLDALEASEYFALETVDDETFRAARARFRDWDDNGVSFTDFTNGVQMAALELDHVMTFDAHLALFDVSVHPPLERR